MLRKFTAGSWIATHVPRDLDLAARACIDQDQSCSASPEIAVRIVRRRGQKMRRWANRFRPWWRTQHVDAGDIEEEEVADVRVSGYVPTASTPDSFAEWVAPHLSVLTAVAIREVGRNDADDVVQDAVTRAWQRRASYRPERGTARVWLLTLVMDQARRRRVHTARHAVADPTATPPDLTGPDDAADHHAQRLDVERAVASLPRRQREVVTLYYLAGLSAGEVGAVLKISVGTVKSQLSDARATLRLTLERS